MRCACCDKLLKADEIKIHPDLKQWDYCFSCLEIISDVFQDGLDEEEIDRQLEFEWGEEYEADKILDNSIEP